MIENVFKSYVNANLRAEPETLIKMLSDFDKYTKFRIESHNKLKALQTIRYIVALIRSGSLKRAEKIKKNKQFKKEYYTKKNALGGEDYIYYPRNFELAFTTLFGYKAGYCESKCNLRKFRIVSIPDYRFVGKDRINCVECDQLHFKHMIREIAKGKKYIDIAQYPVSYKRSKNKIIVESIAQLTDLLEHSFHHINHNLLIKHDLVEDVVIDLDIGEYSSFSNGIILGILAANSLCQFLLKNDRKKIRICHNCDLVYVSKTLALSKYCSDKCRMAYHNRKRLESGEHTRYKRDRIASGQATPSYFGPDPNKGKRK